MRYIDQLNRPTASCDFNLTTEGGFVPFAAADVVGLRPQPGEWLTLQDEDGNTCLGVVSHVSGPILYACALWETWQTAAPSESLSRTVVLYPHSTDSDAPANSASPVRHNDFASANRL